MTRKAKKGEPKFDEDERGVHRLMRSLREEVAVVSKRFRGRVRSAIDSAETAQAAASKRQGLGASVLVQVLNLFTSVFVRPQRELGEDKKVDESRPQK